MQVSDISFETATQTGLRGRILDFYSKLISRAAVTCIGAGMTRVDLVETLLLLGDLTRRGCEVIVDTMLEAMIATLQADDKVEIRGFGSFRTRKRNLRIGRNPKSGARVEVPAKRIVFFKPAKDLRDLVNRDEIRKAKGD